MANVGEVFDFTVTDSTLIGLLQKINSFTDVGFGGILGIMILLIVGGGLLMMMRVYGNERAFAVSSIITATIAVLLRIIGLINDGTLWACIALFIVGVLYLIMEQGKYD